MNELLVAKAIVSAKKLSSREFCASIEQCRYEIAWSQVSAMIQAERDIAHSYSSALELLLDGRSVESKEQLELISMTEKSWYKNVNADFASGVLRLFE